MNEEIIFYRVVMIYLSKNEYLHKNISLDIKHYLYVNILQHSSLLFPNNEHFIKNKKQRLFDVRLLLLENVEK